MLAMLFNLLVVLHGVHADSSADLIAQLAFTVAIVVAVAVAFRRAG